MRKKLLIVFCEILVLLALTSCGQTAIKATVEPLDTNRIVSIDGQERNYLLHIPSGLMSDTAVPLVFVFHGYNETPVSVQLYTDMNTVADANGFVVVYPAGYAGGWNAVCCGGAVTDNVDDPAFVRQILTDLGTIIPVDPKRIFASGFSNGALLTYRLACEMSDVFAAVAPVAGSLLTNPCQPQAAVSLIHMHGLMDTSVPYDGGPSPVIPDLVFLSVSKSVETWVKLDECNDSPDVKKEDHLTYTSYSGCKPNIAVELVTNDVVTHAWPSKYVMMNPTLSEMIWKFFESHPKP